MESEIEPDPEEQESRWAWRQRELLAQRVSWADLTVTRLDAKAEGVKTGLIVALIINVASLAYMLEVALSSRNYEIAFVQNSRQVLWLAGLAFLITFALAWFLWTRWRVLRLATRFGHRHIIEGRKILSRMDSELLDLDGVPGYYGKEDA